MKIKNIKLKKIAALIISAAVLAGGICLPCTGAAAEGTAKNTSLFSAQFDDADTLAEAGADIWRTTTTLYEYTDDDKAGIPEFASKYGTKGLKITNHEKELQQVQFTFPSSAKLTAGQQGVLSYDYYAVSVSGGEALQTLTGGYNLLNLNHSSAPGTVGYVTQNDTGAWTPVKIASFLDGWNHIDMVFSLSSAGRIIDFYIDGDHKTTYTSKYVGDINSVKFAMNKTSKNAVYYIDNLSFTKLGDFDGELKVTGDGRTVQNGMGGSAIEITLPENVGDTELATVKAGNALLTKKNGNETVSVSKAEVKDNKIIIIPAKPLDYDEQYVLELKDFKDMWGRSFPAKEFKAESEYDESGKPVLRVTNMLLETYNGELTEAANSVTPEIKKVHLHLNTGIKTDTLDNCIEINKNSDGFSYDFNADNKILTVDLNGMLVGSTDYTIDVVRDNVQTEAGAKVQPYSRSFKTTEGSFRVGKFGWEDGDGAKLDELKSGKAYLTAELINTTGKGEAAVLSYYKDGEIDFAMLNVGSGKCVSVRFEIDIDTNEKELGGMLYDTNDKLNPLEQSKYLVKTEPSEPEFTLSGKAKANSKQILQVFRPELKNDKLIIADGTDYSRILVYQGEVTADEKGNWSKRIDIDDKTSGQYWYYITSESGERAIENNYVYINAEENAPALDWLEGITDAPTSEQFKENQAELGFYNELLTDTNEAEIMELMYAAKTEGLYSKFTAEDAVNIFNKAVVRTELAEKNISDVLNYAKAMGFDENTDMGKYLDDSFVENGVNLRNLMTSRLSGKTFESFESFDNAFTESFVLAAVRYPDGYENAQKVMKTYAGKIGVSESKITSAVAQAVIGKEYENYSELRKAINSVKETSDKKYSGSSGGSGGTKYMNAELPVSDNTQPLEEVNPVQDKTVFVDLSEVEWAREAIMLLYDKKIVNGKESGKFYPNDKITRAEFIKLLVCAFDLQNSDAEISFYDVSNADWYFDYIKTAVANGIAFGNDNGSFGANDNITRQDMAVMVYRALGAGASDGSAYTMFTDDADIAGYARDAVYVLRDKKIISGFETGEFAPNDNATRAEAAMIIYNIIREAL